MVTTFNVIRDDPYNLDNLYQSTHRNVMSGENHQQKFWGYTNYNQNRLEIYCHQLFREIFHKHNI